MGDGNRCLVSPVHCEDLFSSIIFKQLFKGRIKVSQENPASSLPLKPRSQELHFMHTAPLCLSTELMLTKVFLPGLLPPATRLAQTPVLPIPPSQLFCWKGSFTSKVCSTDLVASRHGTPDLPAALPQLLCRSKLTLCRDQCHPLGHDFGAPMEIWLPSLSV